ncbi:hypothetical protein NIES4102_18260 [Chondrocystis sp. NIES-4102]|nr:hypothetical protein NIES4102_18260 [Chondrocystis sp. NIES-4102]
MSYCTFDRFEGMWLGSLINSDLTASWIINRNKIAEILIKAEKLEVSFISKQIEEIIVDSKDLNSRQIAAKQRHSLGEYQNTLLPLLPLIIFFSDNQDFLGSIIAQCQFKTSNETEIKADILIWGYIVAMIADGQKKSLNPNIHIIVTQLLATAKIKTTLIDKLEIVSRGCHSGITWQELTQELLKEANWGQSAIALAVYCFASTPQHFRLSIQRAANLNTELAKLTTALTGTLSGAYNGMTTIPWSWRSINYNDQIYQQTQIIGTDLWKSWLGIYSINEQQLPYSQQLHAVALPNRIQPRKTLKIISQKIYLS